MALVCCPRFDVSDTFIHFVVQPSLHGIEAATDSFTFATSIPVQTFRIHRIGIETDDLKLNLIYVIMPVIVRHPEFLSAFGSVCSVVLLATLAAPRTLR